MITREQIETEPWLGNQRDQVRELFEAYGFAQGRAEMHEAARQSETNRANELRAEVAVLREVLAYVQRYGLEDDGSSHSIEADISAALASTSATSDAWAAKVRAAALEEAAKHFEGDGTGLATRAIANEIRALAAERGGAK